MELRKKTIEPYCFLAIAAIHLAGIVLLCIFPDASSMIVFKVSVFAVILTSVIFQLLSLKNAFLRMVDYKNKIKIVFLVTVTLLRDVLVISLHFLNLFNITAHLANTLSFSLYCIFWAKALTMISSLIYRKSEKISRVVNLVSVAILFASTVITSLDLFFSFIKF